MKYPAAFLDQLRQAVPLSSVIGARIGVRRHGREYMALCPFHKEKTPSFTISDEKGFFHCFGCGAHGDAIGFIKDYEGISYKEAIEKLAQELGVALPLVSAVTQQKEQERRSLQSIQELACRWFEAQLESTLGYEARDYLANRGLSAETIQRFRLGFAPDDRHALTRYLSAEGVEEREMIAAGLVIQPDGGRPAYDRFRGRVMFPIRNGRSEVIAFGGRLLSNDKTSKAPKYLNSPETELFSKGQMLYNYDLTRRAVREAAHLLVCEGYMDVIALSQAGIHGAVAPLGTALTAAQLQQLWALHDEPVLSLDGDAAGMRAMRRAAEVALPLLTPGKSLRFLTLPAGEDPDSLVRTQGREAFLRLAERAQPMVERLCDEVLHARATTPEERAGQEQTLLNLADSIQHPIVRAHYREHIRQRIWQRPAAPSTSRARGGMKQVKATSLTQKQAVRLPNLPGSHDLESRKTRAARYAVALVLQHGELLNEAEVEAFLYDLDVPDRALAGTARALMEMAGEADANALEALRGQADIRLQRDMALVERQANQLPHGILAMWQRVSASYRKACLLEEYQQAERELAQQMTDARFSRFTALKAELERLEQQQSVWQQELFEHGG